LPVRVIRGAGHDSPYSPSTGYSYDGLYSVDDYWHETGRSGFRVWRYRLIKLPEQQDEEHQEKPDVEDSEAPLEASRRETTVLRIVRDTRQTRRIKELYDYRCQMCGERLEGLPGPYAEAAHIRPLGTPHNGRGYATEIGRFGLDHAFSVLGVEEVVSFTEVHNLRSRAVMERLGMR
jgi:putative restriction endonuclease